jgi:toxin ParE1/3/4
MNVVIRDAAYADLDRIEAWIANDRPLAARRVIDRILNSVELLGLFPRLGHPGRISGTCEWVVAGLPYIIVYTIDADADEIAVIAIFHTAQNR